MFTLDVLDRTKKSLTREHRGLESAFSAPNSQRSLGRLREYGAGVLALSNI
jgi:hypothetical protein